jgi:glucose-1-phosphate cytidylyltransferase
MVEIGRRPMLWHIMKHYAHYGFTEFVVALGYRGDVIRRYFVDHVALRDDLTIDLANGRVTLGEQVTREPWTIHLVETGDLTNTGGRLLRLKNWLGNEPFFLTYGDGLSNLNLHDLLCYHRTHDALATVTAVHPPARFGGLRLDEDRVVEFTEKSQAIEGWINGGFFVFEPAIFDYLHEASDSLEHDALTRVADEGQLRAFRHADFWQCMDTVRDVRLLNELWSGDNPPWKLWH